MTLIKLTFIFIFSKNKHTHKTQNKEAQIEFKRKEDECNTYSFFKNKTTNPFLLQTKIETKVLTTTRTKKTHTYNTYVKVRFVL